MVQKIDSFKGDFFFLSNFYERPVLYEGLVYQNTEAAFQAAKCESIHDRKQFCTLRPSQAKQLGRRVYLRPDWEGVKDQVMKDILQCKFSQSPHLKMLLLETGDALLVEGNTWHDNYWGNCTCPRCQDIQGRNQLGKTLMQIREELRHEKKL